jgi:putative ABC transport system permease protein
VNLLTICVAYLRARALTNGLNVLLLALGFGTIIVLLLFTEQVAQRLTRDAAGIDLVVGAKGSPLQLILSTVYHLDIPTGAIPVVDARRVASNPMIAGAIPVALGDTYRGYRIVGTTKDYATNYGAMLARGRDWIAPMEVVIGADVAARTKADLGTRFAGAHGLVENGEEHVSTPYSVVGVLQPTGTVLDRLVLTPVESVWAVHEHRRGDHDEEQDDRDRQITALLLKYRSPLAAASLPREINRTSALQAASPAFESARLLNLLGVGTDALRAFAGVLILGAALSVFVALYNSLKDRRYDLAIMRTLGSSRLKLLLIVLLEGMVVALVGAVMGVFLGHAAMEALARWFAHGGQTGATGWIWLTQEWWILGLALVVGCVAALLPAWLAYRTDIAQILARG